MEDSLTWYQLVQMNGGTRRWSGMMECIMVQLITCIYPIFIDYSNSQLFAARVMDKGLSNSMICGWGLTACSAHHKWLGLSCCWSRLMGGQRGTGRAVLAIVLKASPSRRLGDEALQGSKASWTPCLIHVRKGWREGEGRKRTKTDQR